MYKKDGLNEVMLHLIEEYIGSILSEIRMKIWEKNQCISSPFYRKHQFWNLEVSKSILVIPVFES